MNIRKRIAFTLRIRVKTCVHISEKSKISVDTTNESKTTVLYGVIKE
jgi:hypothetical protein